MYVNLQLALTINNNISGFKFEVVVIYNYISHFSFARFFGNARGRTDCKAVLNKADEFEVTK